MRALSPAARDAHAGDVVPLVLMVEMQLSKPVLLNSSSHDLTINGATSYGAGGLGGVETVDDSPGEFKNLVFSLSGVSNDLLGIALNESTRGRPVSMRLATLDPETFEVLDSSLVWSGTLDQMPIARGKASSVINVTAEHRGITFARPKPLNYNDSDQQRLFGGDTSLRFIQSQSTHPDVWPAASYGRK